MLGRAEEKREKRNGDRNRKDGTELVMQLAQGDV